MNMVTQMVDGQAMSHDMMEGTIPFYGEIHSEEGSRKITGDISWGTLLPTQNLEEGKRDILMIFFIDDELGETPGGKVRLDCDFVAQLAKKSRTAQETLLKNILKDWKGLEGYNIHCA